MRDLKPFFDHVRRGLFKGQLNQSQVEGMNAIIAAADAAGVKDTHLAYMLATTYHETARTMQPIEEYGRGRGHAYGNKHPVTGEAYYGRGYVQLTWYSNYEKAGKKLRIDLVNRPSLALDPVIAAEIMIAGMTEGWFTSRKLSDYDRLDGQFNAIGARRIINGRNKKRYEQRLDADADYDRVIAGHYDVFLQALKLAGPVSKPVDAEAPRPAEREPTPQRVPEPPRQEQPEGLLVRFFRWLLSK